MGYDRIVYIRYHFSCGLDRKDACWLSFTPLTGMDLICQNSSGSDHLWLHSEVGRNEGVGKVRLQGTIFVRLFVCSFVCLFVCLFVLSLFVCLFVCLFGSRNWI